MVNVYETGSDEMLNFGESLKTMDDNQLNNLKRDLKSKDTPEADSQLALVLKEMDERKREKETGTREISMEEKTMVLNGKIQSIRASFEEKKSKIDRSTSQGKAEYKLLIEQEAAAIKKQIQEFAYTDVGSFEGSKRSIEETKDAEIARLTGLLEEKPSITNAIKDRLSPSSLKLQNVEKHIQKLKNDTSNYPGNMLRYLSSLTTSYFLTPLQRVKGGWQTLSKNWQSDEELGKRYDAIKEILLVNHGDSAWRMNLKQRLRGEFEAAQKQFVENAKNRARKQVGLAA